MVLQPAGPRLRGPDSRSIRPESPRFDGVRIVGLSGMLALNAMLFMVLLVHASRDGSDDALPERRQELAWITPPPPKPIPQPERVEMVQPRNVPAPTAPPREAQAVPVEAPVLVDAGALYAPMPTVDTTAADVVAPTIDASPRAGVALQYARALAPDYPRAARLAGAEGVVVLEVHVGRDGRPLHVRVHRSSGNPELDRAALRQIQRQWTFQPAMRNGTAVEAIGLVPVAFNLARGRGEGRPRHPSDGMAGPAVRPTGRD